VSVEEGEERPRRQQLLSWVAHRPRDDDCSARCWQPRRRTSARSAPRPGRRVRRHARDSASVATSFAAARSSSGGPEACIAAPAVLSDGAHRAGWPSSRLRRRRTNNSSGFVPVFRPPIEAVTEYSSSTFVREDPARSVASGSRPRQLSLELGARCRREVTSSRHSPTACSQPRSIRSRQHAIGDRSNGAAFAWEHDRDACSRHRFRGSGNAGSGSAVAGILSKIAWRAPGWP
jgi:hypothetical protein